MHLDTNLALDFAEGRLKRDVEAFWKGHMEVCDQCAKDVLHWQQLGKDLKRSHLTSAPRQNLDHVLLLFSQPQKEEAAGLRSLIAAVVFDSFLQPAMAGVRGASTVARQVVMRAEEFDIHIKIWGEGDGRQMLGQLLPRHGKEFAKAARFHLLRDGTRLDSTTTDETGEFHFAQVPQGDLSLQIDLPNLTVIGALNIQEKV